MATLRTVKLKRTDLGSSAWSSLKLKLAHGEPLIIKKSNNFYQTLGTNDSSVVEASGTPVIKYVTNTIADRETFFVTGAFDLTRVSDVRKCMDDLQVQFYPMTIDSAVYVKKDSSGSSYANVRTLAQKLARIDAVIGDINDAAGTVGAQNGNHETRVDTIETTIGINGHAPGTGSQYINSTASTLNVNYYLLGVNSTDTTVYNARPATRTHGNAGVYWNGSTGSLFGASWNNDYAETREIVNWNFFETSIEPGDCVAETGSGKLALSCGDLLPCAYIVSDTYGVVIGSDELTPVAISGRVLAKVVGDPEDYHLGDCLCTADFGRLRKMTRREVRKYPDCIVGIVCEIPNYSEWHGRKVNRRVWIKVR